jgi:hypothetical protein
MVEQLTCRKMFRAHPHLASEPAKPPFKQLLLANKDLSLQVRRYARGQKGAAGSWGVYFAACNINDLGVLICCLPCFARHRELSGAIHTPSAVA